VNSVNTIQNAVVLTSRRLKKLLFLCWKYLDNMAPEGWCIELKTLDMKGEPNIRVLLVFRRIVDRESFSIKRMVCRIVPAVLTLF